jgi:hypothetical protein
MQAAYPLVKAQRWGRVMSAPWRRPPDAMHR